MNAFRLPTWQGELRVQGSSNQGSTLIHLNEGFEAIKPRYPQILIVPRYGDPFTITVGEYISNGVFECSELPVHLYGGEYASFYPFVRFSEDQLTFDFVGPNMCIVKATFVEVHSD